MEGMKRWKRYSLIGLVLMMISTLLVGCKKRIGGEDLTFDEVFSHEASISSIEHLLGKPTGKETITKNERKVTIYTYENLGFYGAFGTLVFAYDKTNGKVDEIKWIAHYNNLAGYNEDRKKLLAQANGYDALTLPTEETDDFDTVMAADFGFFIWFLTDNLDDPTYIYLFEIVGDSVDETGTYLYTLAVRMY